MQALPPARQVDVPGVVHGDGEAAPGLVAVLVGGGVQHVVLSLRQHLARHPGGHHVGYLHVVRENRLLPEHLTNKVSHLCESCVCIYVLM